jgi:hypothetical protein
MINWAGTGFYKIICEDVDWILAHWQPVLIKVMKHFDGKCEKVL